MWTYSFEDYWIFIPYGVNCIGLWCLCLKGFPLGVGWQTKHLNLCIDTNSLIRQKLTGYNLVKTHTYMYRQSLTLRRGIILLLIHTQFPVRKLEAFSNVDIQDETCYKRCRWQPQVSFCCCVWTDHLKFSCHKNNCPSQLYKAIILFTNSNQGALIVCLKIHIK